MDLPSGDRPLKAQFASLAGFTLISMIVKRTLAIAVVVSGGTPFASILVMDSEFGFTTASKLGSAYVYSSGYSGASLKTISAARRL